MSLKKKIFNFLTAVVTIFGSAPVLAHNAYAAIDPDMKPNYGKYVEDNGDGTYDITLHITGKAKTNTQVTKANVVVAFDVSNSMEYCTGTGKKPTGKTCSASEGESRLSAAKAATKAMAQSLLALNDASNPNTKDVVDMKFISFHTTASNASSSIKSYSAAETWVNNLSTPNGNGSNGGTNWEAALERANSVSFDDTTQGEKTYIIFISDGDPTFRDSKGTYSYDPWDGGICQDKNGNYHYENRGSSSKYGNGNSDPCGQNLAYAQDQATAITNAGKILYSIGIYGDADVMESVGGNFIDAKTTNDLKNALSSIASKITNTLSLSEITFEDGITSLADIAISGTAANFTYRKGKNWDGNESTLKNLASWNPTADGAGTASYANKKVTWDLGTNYVLSDGETATVTFTVYPDQEAYDLLAELEKGTIFYDDLTPAQQQSLVQSGNSYAFQTNTETPTVHYCVLTSSSTGSQSKECSTDTLTNSPAKSLSVSKVGIRKKWDAGLDTTQINDAGTRITLNLLLPDSDAAKGGLQETDLTLDQSNSWTLPRQISIAPGIMVSEGHEAYDANRSVSYKGVSYTILTAGHDYYFEEPGINKHFTLVDYEYHPMLVDGTLKNVFFNADGTIAKIKSLGNNAELTATNRLKGGLEIRKEVYKNDVLDATSTDEFDITIYVKHADGRTNYASQLNADGTCELSCVSVYEQNGSNWTRISKTAFSDGKIETTIRTDQKIIVSDLEAGAYYYVEEDTANLPLGYNQTKSGAVTYDIERFTQLEDDEQAPEFKSKQIDGKTYYTVENNASSKGLIKNYYYTGSLKLTKTVEKHGLNPATTDFDFTVKIQGRDDQTVTLQDGGTLTISDLPVGATYSVTENDYSGVGFTTTSTGTTGTIKRDQNGKPAQTAAFTNTYSVSPVKTTITVRKSGFDDYWDLSHLQDQEFEFCIESKNLCQSANRLTKSTTFTFTYDTPTTESLVVTEKTTNFAPGVVRKSGDADITANIVVNDNGYGKLVATVERTKGSLTYRTDEVAEIFNDYQLAPTDPITVTLEKIINDLSGNAEDTTFHFALTDSQGAVQNFHLTTSDLTAETELFTAIFTEAGTYTYTVQEINDGQKYFDYDSAEHTITIDVTDGLNGQLIATVTIDNEDTTTLTITNFYNNEPGQGGVELPKAPNTGRGRAQTLSRASSSLLADTFAILLIASLGAFLLTLRTSRRF